MFVKIGQWLDDVFKFVKIGEWLDGIFKPVTDWWVTIYREKCDTGSAKGCWIVLTWLAVCFGPVGLYWIHRFIFNIWLATFTSYTPFADHSLESDIRRKNKRALLHKAEQCIIDHKNGIGE